MEIFRRSACCYSASSHHISGACYKPSVICVVMLHAPVAEHMPAVTVGAEECSAWQAVDIRHHKRSDSYWCPAAKPQRAGQLCCRSP